MHVARFIRICTVFCSYSNTCTLFLGMFLDLHISETFLVIVFNIFKLLIFLFLFKSLFVNVFMYLSKKHTVHFVQDI